jgi:3-dehydroquinate dehydratase II
MHRISILHGPNLNLLGSRQPEIYGSKTFDEVLAKLITDFENLDIQFAQSNVEGDLVTLIQQHGFKSDYIILNAAAYTHTSIAIADAVAAVPANVIGIHLSNIYQREEERHIDLLAKYCEACLFGFGVDGYRMALEYINNKYEE